MKPRPAIKKTRLALLIHNLNSSIAPKKWVYKRASTGLGVPVFNIIIITLHGTRNVEYIIDNPGYSWIRVKTVKPA